MDIVLTVVALFWGALSCMLITTIVMIIKRRRLNLHGSIVKNTFRDHHFKYFKMGRDKLTLQILTCSDAIWNILFTEALVNHAPDQEQAGRVFYKNRHMKQPISVDVTYLGTYLLGPHGMHIWAHRCGNGNGLLMMASMVDHPRDIFVFRPLRSDKTPSPTYFSTTDKEQLFKDLL